MDTNFKPIQIFTLPEKLSLSAHFLTMGVLVGGMATYVGSAAVCGLAVLFAVAHEWATNRRAEAELRDMINWSQSYLSTPADKRIERVRGLMQGYQRCVHLFAKRANATPPAGPLIALDPAPGVPEICGLHEPKNSAVVCGASFYSEFNSRGKRAILAHEVAHHARGDLQKQQQMIRGLACLEVLSMANLFCLDGSWAVRSLGLAAVVLPNVVKNKLPQTSTSAKLYVVSELMAASTIIGHTLMTRDKSMLVAWSIAKGMPCVGAVVSRSLARSCEYGADRLGALLYGSPKRMIEMLSQLEASTKPKRRAPRGLTLVMSTVANRVAALFQYHPTGEKRCARLRQTFGL